MHLEKIISCALSYGARLSFSSMPRCYKNTKNIQKSDYMDGFCLQGELDLTLFYKIEGYFDNLKSLMTLMTVTLMTGKRP